MVRSIRKGFTLVELCAVIAILSILASISAVAYLNMRTNEADGEAIDIGNALYAQAQRTISEWSIGDGDQQIPAGCIGNEINSDAWKNYGMYHPDAARTNDQPTRWDYNVCFGQIEGRSAFVVTARKRSANIDSEPRIVPDRYMFMGTNIEKPLIDNFTDVPEVAVIPGVVDRGGNLNVFFPPRIKKDSH